MAALLCQTYRQTPSTHQNHKASNQLAGSTIKKINKPLHQQREKEKHLYSVKKKSEEQRPLPEPDLWPEKEDSTEEKAMIMQVLSLRLSFPTSPLTDR